MPDNKPVIAYFISAHGLGHAARAAAVMAAVHRAAPQIRFEIFTAVPPWFFDDCLTGPFACHALQTDVGLVQTSPLKEDLPATIQALDTFYPLDEQRVRAAAARIKSLGCRLVVCDIAPLGIAVARAAGRPSVLVENFTWDWIYTGYAAWADRLKPHTDYLRALFGRADYHIQAEPVCAPGNADLTVAPIGRPPRRSAADTRDQLAVPDDKTLVVLTLGGTAVSPGRLPLDGLSADVYLVVPGSCPQRERTGRLLRLPQRSGVYHPDLIQAADAVIGKAGYSTLAEIYQADASFGYVSRADFREAPILETFARENLRGLNVPAAALADGTWAALIPALTALPKSGTRRTNGAEQVAAFLLEIAAQ